MGILFGSKSRQSGKKKNTYVIGFTCFIFEEAESWQEYHCALLNYEVLSARIKHLISSIRTESRVGNVR